ncbi:MAG: general secretion pathway protein GspK [Syntrophales bacterium]
MKCSLSKTFEFLLKRGKSSYRRKPVSSFFETFWIPAFAGMTKRADFQSSLWTPAFAGVTRKVEIQSPLSSNRGSAIILIMFMAGVIMTVGLGFNWLVKEHIKAAEGLKNKVEAILKARSAYDTLIYLILNGRILQKDIELLGVQDLTTVKRIPLNGADINLGEDVYAGVQESHGLLSLTNRNITATARLIGRLGKVENPAISVESIQDWVDPDDFSRTNGAEKFYYQGRQMPYQPRNYAIQYKEEIALVRGIDREIYRKIEPYLTILPASGFNPNTAGDEVLRAVLDINDESLNKLKDYMSKTPLSSSAGLFFLTGRQLNPSMEDMDFKASRFMEIKVKVGAPKNLYTIKAGLNFIPTPNVPYSVVYWQEE